MDGSDVTITSGKQIDGAKDTNDALISTSMASTNGLKVGSTFTACGKTLTVAGIFRGDSTSLMGDTVITSLATWQRLSGSGDEVTSATATVDSLSNLSAVTTALKNKLGSSADVTSNLTQANDALQPLKSIESVSLYSLIGAVFAGAVIILLTMIMIVRERKREIGVFKAIGFSNVRIMLQFMGESLTFTILGAVIGLVFGLAGANPITSALVNSGNGSDGPGSVKVMSISSSSTTLQSLTDVHTEVGFSIILYGLSAAILIALIGSALASYFISTVRPAEVLRSE
jgi:putative ABC transport system permease protein